jgi:hypothetical protein
MADLVEKAWQRYLIALHKHPLRTKVNDSSLFSFFLSLSLSALTAKLLQVDWSHDSCIMNAGDLILLFSGSF